jgi:hypothetical protein
MKGNCMTFAVVPKVYEITLRSGTRYILAPNSEDAAWSALELSQEHNDQLINVKLRDEW